MVSDPSLYFLHYVGGEKPAWVALLPSPPQAHLLSHVQETD